LGFDWPALDAEREATHGNFTDMALVATACRDALHWSPRYVCMSSAQKVAVDEIVLKLARIVCGDPSFPGHWDDVIGYAVKGRCG
jgi:hypothetical protein